MTALRKVVDSSALTGIFDLPPALKNRKVEVVLFPVDDTQEDASTSNENILPRLTMEQIKNWAKEPDIFSLVGALKATNLPANISIKDIRDMRLKEKYNQ